MSGALYSFMSFMSSLGLPDGAPFQLRAACRALAPLSAALLGLGVAGIWVMPLRAHIVVLAALIIATAALGRCWTAAILSADGRDNLIMLSADLLRRVPDGDLPPLLAASGR